MYIKDLALNNLQWLICHKTKSNQTNFNKRLKNEMDLHRIRALYADND